MIPQLTPQQSRKMLLDACDRLLKTKTEVWVVDDFDFFRESYVKSGLKK